MTVPTPLTRILTSRVIAIVRARTQQQARVHITSLQATGDLPIEISLTTPGALALIEEIAAEGWPVGAGTVTTIDEFIACQRAGAAFTLSPAFDPGVVSAARDRDVLHIPGVATPSEALAAHRLGSPLQKLFPASTWTPASMADLLKAMPYLRLVPTGGVDVLNAESWLSSGAVAVGLGSSLTRFREREGAAGVERLLAKLAALPDRRH